MREPIERYLEDVLCQADLARDDEREIRAELAEHLHVLVESHGSSNPNEVYAMLTDQFGNPKKVGRAIAAAKGKFRTYLKKLRRKLPLQLAAALVLAFAVRFAVAESFYVSGDGVAPLIPRGSRVLVYKLASSFKPGDIVVHRNAEGVNLVGEIDRENNSGRWRIERNAGCARQVQEVPRDRIVGRVFLNTR